MKLLSFDDVHTNTFLDEFNKKYENRKKIHSEYKLTDDKERVEADKKRQDEELDKIKF
jgi:hypothetical protein